MKIIYFYGSSIPWLCQINRGYGDHGGMRLHEIHHQVKPCGKHPTFAMDVFGVMKLLQREVPSGVFKHGLLENRRVFHYRCDFPIESLISSGFVLATFDDRRAHTLW